MVGGRRGPAAAGGARGRGADAEAAGEAVGAALFGLGALGEVGAPGLALVLVVTGAKVDGEVELDHARGGLGAQLEGRAGGLAAVGARGVLEDEDAAVGGEGGLDEDVNAGDDGVVGIVVGTGTSAATTGGGRAVVVGAGVGGHGLAALRRERRVDEGVEVAHDKLDDE